MSDPTRKPSDAELAAQMYGRTTPTRPGELPVGRGAVPQIYKWTVPPGYEHLKPDAGLHDIFSGVAKDIGLTQVQANILLHLFVRLTQDPKAPKYREAE